MRTLTKSTFWSSLFLGILLLLVATSCSGKATPSERATLPAGYVRFHPEQGSLFEIEFDHPEKWVLLPTPSYEFNSFLIYDPLVQPAPTRPTSARYEPVKWGRIMINVYQVSNPEETVDVFVDTKLRAAKNPVPDQHGNANAESEILENLTGEIDGARLRQITIRTISEWQGEKYISISREFLFYKGDRVYSFYIIIPEKDSNNEFAKAFDYMISSIRFIR